MKKKTACAGTIKKLRDAKRQSMTLRRWCARLKPGTLCSKFAQQANSAATQGLKVVRGKCARASKALKKANVMLKAARSYF
jgi:hypothetical protein